MSVIVVVFEGAAQSVPRPGGEAVGQEDGRVHDRRGRERRAQSRPRAPEVIAVSEGTCPARGRRRRRRRRRWRQRRKR